MLYILANTQCFLRREIFQCRINRAWCPRDRVVPYKKLVLSKCWSALIQPAEERNEEEVVPRVELG